MKSIKQISIEFDGDFTYALDPLKGYKKKHRYTFEEMNQYVDDERWDENMDELNGWYIMFCKHMTDNKIEELKQKPVGEVYDSFIHRDLSDRWASMPGIDKWEWKHE